MNDLVNKIFDFINCLGKTTKAWILVVVTLYLFGLCQDIAGWFAMKFVLSLIIVLPVLGLLLFMFVAWYSNKFFDKKDNVILIIIESLINTIRFVINGIKWVIEKIIGLLSK